MADSKGTREVAVPGSEVATSGEQVKLAGVGQHWFSNADRDRFQLTDRLIRRCECNTDQ